VLLSFIAPYDEAQGATIVVIYTGKLLKHIERQVLPHSRQFELMHSTPSGGQQNINAEHSARIQQIVEI
jgi:hypothetical protein